MDISWSLFWSAPFSACRICTVTRWMPNPAAEPVGVYERVELWPTLETSLFEALPSAFQPSGGSGSNGASCLDFPQPNNRIKIVAKPNHRPTFMEPFRSRLMKTTKIMKSRARSPVLLLLGLTRNSISKGQKRTATSQEPKAKWPRADFVTIALSRKSCTECFSKLKNKLIPKFYSLQHLSAICLKFLDSHILIGQR